MIAAPNWLRRHILKRTGISFSHINSIKVVHPWSKPKDVPDKCEELGRIEYSLIPAYLLLGSIAGWVWVSKNKDDVTVKLNLPKTDK